MYKESSDLRTSNSNVLENSLYTLGEDAFSRFLSKDFTKIEAPS
jgi:hypothetical protein